MAKAKRNGNGRLEEATAKMQESMERLLQTQIMLAQSHAAFLAEKAETDRQNAETNRVSAERFARIETILLDHSRILAEHRVRFEKSGDYSGIESAPSVGPCFGSAISVREFNITPLA